MGLVGKRCKIFIRDGSLTKVRTGKIIDESVSCITYKNEFGTDAIPTCNVIRMEVLD